MGMFALSCVQIFDTIFLFYKVNTNVFNVLAGMLQLRNREYILTALIAHLAE